MVEKSINRSKYIKHIKKNNINISVIIQARMSSTRLPNKILIDICGKPLLEHVTDRIKMSEYKPGIIIATTINEKDKIVEEFADNIGIDIFRGSEEDVLERYYMTASRYKSDIVIRVCSDNALFDYSVMDNMLDGFFESGDADYLSNSLEKTLPVGINCEIFTYKALEKSYKEADTQPCREHVTPYMFLNPDKFKVVSYKINRDLSEYRWTLDTEEDLELITGIYEYFYEKYGQVCYFGMDEVIKAYENNPHWYDINGEVQQKLIGYKGR